MEGVSRGFGARFLARSACYSEIARQQFDEGLSLNQRLRSNLPFFLSFFLFIQIIFVKRY